MAHLVKPREVVVAADGEVEAGLLGITLPEADGGSGGDPFNMAIVDMKMPGMNGLELAATVRNDPALGAMRLVLVTSLHSTDEMARSSPDAPSTSTRSSRTRASGSWMWMKRGSLSALLPASGLNMTSTVKAFASPRGLPRTRI